MSSWGSSCPQSPPWDLLSRVPCLQWRLIALRAGGQGPSLTTPLSGGSAALPPPRGSSPTLWAILEACGSQDPLLLSFHLPVSTSSANTTSKHISLPPGPCPRPPCLQGALHAGAGTQGRKGPPDPPACPGAREPQDCIHHRHLFLLNLNPDSNPSERSDLEKVTNLSGSRFPSDKWL